MGNKIQRIYVGDKRVRPNKYEYSYDFTTGDKSDFVSQGWTTSSTYSIDSNGLSSTSTREVIIVDPYPGLNNALQNATYVHMEMTWQKTGSTDRSQHGFYTYGGGSNGTGIYGDGYTNRAVIGGTYYLNSQTSIANGTYLLTEDLDFKNKTISWSVPGYFNGSSSISDSEIADTKLSTGMRIIVSQYSRIKDVKITITY